MRQYVPRVSDADVERVVRRDFPPDQWDAVLSLLRQQQQISGVRLTRVQAAMVKVSMGDVNRLLACFELDDRDVIGAAEYPNVSAAPSRPHDVTVSEAREWCVKMSRLIKADADQYQDWLNGPSVVRTDNGI